MMTNFGRLLEIVRDKMRDIKAGKKMTTLDVKKLTSCGSDWETNQYTILNKVKLWKKQLHKNILFPALEESIQLSLSLEEILRENLECKLWFDTEIKVTRLNERISVYEKAHQVGFQLDKLLEFTEWALKLNRPVLDEGKILKDFIEENLIVKKISSNNNNFMGNGYFTLPDNKKELLNIYFYEIGWDWTNQNIVHTLNTKLIRSIPLEIIKNPVEELMKEFILHSQELFDPVVFVFETDLDFPYRETMYPLAEEKLLKILDIQ